MSKWFSLLALLAAGAAAAQTPACTYSACALNIIPRLSALDVVRGDAEERVASLGFLVPRRVASAFETSTAARRHAERAFTRRRIAAVFTNVGAVALLRGITRATATSDHRRAALAATAAGAALIGISVPIHFSADAELSRAVREFNRAFAR